MNDAYGSQGYDETDHWTLFGDPSIALRTNAPYNLSINHLGTLDPQDGAYEVIIEDDFDNVLAALSYNGILLGAAYATNGVAIIEIESIFNSRAKPQTFFCFCLKFCANIVTYQKIFKICY